MTNPKKNSMANRISGSQTIEHGEGTTDEHRTKNFQMAQMVSNNASSL
jgi:hypothetical protein